MGIPKFYRWLTSRYPAALQNIDKLEDIPPFDHFYLDLNGIFHKCFHGNSESKLIQISKLKSYDNLWVHIFSLIDQLVHIVKPRQVLLLAIDGVTPRAKLCQQRARRYRSMRDRIALMSQLKQSGQLKEQDNIADANMITPGTWFMNEVSRQIKYLIELKMNTDPLYQKLKIIYSDATVPGEGQHKIMDYIRQFRTSKDYKPNLRHCIYGADADLIMLSLATHEPYFTILREKVEVRKKKYGKIERSHLVATQNYQMLYISVIREYIRLDFKDLEQHMSFPWNLQRIIDDFIFICFFVGNDFIPSLLSLDISIGSLDMLIDIYKSFLTQMDGYLTFQGEIRWERASYIIKNIGKMESKVLEMRMRSIQNLDALQKQYAPKESDQYKESLKQLRIKKQQIIKKFKKFDRLKDQGKLRQYMERLKEEGKISKDKDIYYEDEEDYKEQQDMKNESNEETKIEQTCKLIHIRQRFYQSKLLNSNKTRKISQMKSFNKKIVSSVYYAIYFIEQISKQQQNKREERLLKNTIGYQSEKRQQKVVIDQFLPLDIPDSEISDVQDNKTEQEIEKMALGIKLPQDTPVLSTAQGRNLIRSQLQEIRKQFDENKDFFTQFCSLYKSDPEKAKSKYYEEKFKIDTQTQEGKKILNNILFKYLQGLQWVLFYYYRGPPHWGWFYPYHYPPMITDFTDIVRLIQRYYGYHQEVEKSQEDLQDEQQDKKDEEEEEKEEEIQGKQQDFESNSQQKINISSDKQQSQANQQLQDQTQKIQQNQLSEQINEQNSDLREQELKNQESKQQQQQQSKQESYKGLQPINQKKKIKPKPQEPKTHVKITFDFDDADNMPLQPFLSLLCLMPQTSKDLLPKMFHVAYDKNSPIIDLLPSKVQIDLNGRSLPWQAISLVPFVDVQRVKSCYDSLLYKTNAQKLEPSELQRNIFHVQTVFMCAEGQQNYRDVKSKIKGFPDIPHTQNKVFEYQKSGQQIKQQKPQFFKPIKMGSFKAQLYKQQRGKIIETNFVLPCVDFLTIHRATNSPNYHVELQNVGKTHQKSTTLRLIYKYSQEHEKKLMAQFYEYFKRIKDKSVVYVDYPSCRQAQLCRIISNQIEYQIVNEKEGRGVYVGQRAPMPGQYENARKSASSSLNKKGLIFEGPFIVLSYKKLIKVQRRLQGGIKKIFSKDQEFTPICLATLKRDNKYFQDLKLIEDNPQKMFKIGETSLMLDQNGLGIKSKVVKLSKDKDHGYLNVTVDQKTTQYFNDHIFPQEIIEKNWPKFEPEYYTLDDISHYQRIPYKVLAMLTSNVVVSLKGVPGFQDQATNLGFQLKNKNSKIQASDVVIYDEKSYSFSFRKDVCEAIHQYNEKFPQVIKAISKHVRQQEARRSNQGKMHILDIYPDLFDKKAQQSKQQQSKQQQSKQQQSKQQQSKQQQSKQQQSKQDPTLKLQQKVKQIQDWLASLPISKLPYVPMGTFTLPHQVIDKLITTPLSNNYKYDSTYGIQTSSHYLFNETQPFWMGYNVEQPENFEMGDRVININSMGRKYIKFGLFGTVIGYSSDNKILVLFDEPMFAGYELAPIVLNKSFRLIQVDSTNLINYTQRMNKIQTNEYEQYYGFEACYWNEQGGVNEYYEDDYMSKKWQQKDDGYFYQDNSHQYYHQNHNQNNWHNNQYNANQHQKFKNHYNQQGSWNNNAQYYKKKQ